MILSTVPAKTEDIDIIFSFAKALVETYEDLTAIDFDKVMAWMYRKIADHITEYSCVYADAAKIGYYRFVQEDRQMELDDLYILPEYRNKGYGSQILTECCQATALPVYLYVFSKNTGAVRFYERHGFRISEQVSPTRYIMVRNH